MTNQMVKPKSYKILLPNKNQYIFCKLLIHLNVMIALFNAKFLKKYSWVFKYSNITFQTSNHIFFLKMCLLTWGRFNRNRFLSFCSCADNGLTIKYILLVFAIRFVYINAEITSETNSLLFGICILYLSLLMLMRYSVILFTSIFVRMLY